MSWRSCMSTLALSGGGTALFAVVVVFVAGGGIGAAAAVDGVICGWEFCCEESPGVGAAFHNYRTYKDDDENSKGKEREDRRKEMMSVISHIGRKEKVLTK